MRRKGIGGTRGIDTWKITFSWKYTLMVHLHFCIHGQNQFASDTWASKFPSHCYDSSLQHTSRSQICHYMIDFFSVVTEHKWCTEKKYMSFNSLLKFNHDASLLQTSWSLQDLCKNESLIVFAVRNVNVYVQNQKF